MTETDTRHPRITTDSLLPEVPHALTDPLPVAVIPVEPHPVAMMPAREALPPPAPATTAQSVGRRPRRRRIGLIALYGAAVMLIFTSGAFLGYSQGPRIATWIAAGGSAAAAFQKFQPCFNDLQNSPAFRGAISLFRRPTLEPGVPTPTPQQRTLAPDTIKTLKGKLVSISPTQITVDTSSPNGGTSESLTFFAFHRIVTLAGREITREGLLSGDQVEVLAFRMQENAPHVVMCVMVNVDPQ